MKHYYIQYPYYNTYYTSIMAEYLHRLFNSEKLCVVDTLDATAEYISSGVLLAEIKKHPEKFINMYIDKNKHIKVINQVKKDLNYLDFKYGFIEVMGNSLVVADKFTVSRFFSDSLIVKSSNNIDVISDCGYISKLNFGIGKIDASNNCLIIPFLDNKVKLKIDYNTNKYSFIGGETMSLDNYMFLYLINLEKAFKAHSSTIIGSFMLMGFGKSPSDILKIFTEYSSFISKTTINAWVDFFMRSIPKSSPDELKALTTLVNKFASEEKKVEFSKKIFF